MARMWEVETIDCARDFAFNAREAIPVRVAEVYSHAPSLADPRDGVGHHDLRISIKRLRYSLEFFAVCFDPAEVAAILSALSTMQDLLGDIHDADVFVPELQRTLGELEVERAAAVRELLDQRSPDGGPVDFEEYAAELDRTSTFPYKLGLLGIVNHMRRQRSEAYRAAVELWGRLQDEGFRERLERLATSREARSE